MTYTNGMTFRPALLSNVERAYMTNAVLILTARPLSIAYCSIQDGSDVLSCKTPLYVPT